MYTIQTIIRSNLQQKHGFKVSIISCKFLQTFLTAGKQPVAKYEVVYIVHCGYTKSVYSDYIIIDLI